MRILMVAARCALFVLLSEYEAHPVAVMEALSLRRPVLVSDTSGLRELAANGLCRAIPCNAGPGELAAATAEELEAHREVPDLALPDWDACARALSDVYCDVLSSRPTVRLLPAGVMAWPPATGA
ncbi:glycosyltransferase [Mesorhizobium sp. M1423]|uniref:glycosyltransferase n=1 Tax=Mesorhizobium sp. M1423 TaxID=2957101 RepID=UPI0033352F90